MANQAGLRVPLVLFVFVASVISFCQADYINADFVAYSTVAQRVMTAPQTSITGSWSPLFSWLMVPLMGLGIPDLIAGRLILIASGVCYIFAIHRLACRFFTQSDLLNRILTHGIMTCATIQAIWFSTYLLNPDLLACAIVFWYFVILTDTRQSHPVMRYFLAGATAGFAYLAKAYMLPFCIAQLVAIAMINGVFSSRMKGLPQRVPMGTALVSMTIGLGIIAGPWVAVLTHKYGCLTYTNAGRANHANVGPESFGKDLLWHPPLARDYILEPVIAQESSPFSSFSNFWHQIRLIIHNSGNCAGLIPGWLLLMSLAILIGRRGLRKFDQPGHQIGLWAMLSAAVYCSGYVTVNLETRYIVPVVAPLMCFAAAGLIQATAVQDGVGWTKRFPIFQRSERSLALTSIMLCFVFAAVDVYSIGMVAVKHPQSTSLAAYRELARRLDATGIGHQICASNKYHEGLYLAYVCGNLSNYLGATQSTDPVDLTNELAKNGVQVNIRWTDITHERPLIDEISIARSPKRGLMIVDRLRSTEPIEVYIR
ncbi:MAG: hypothetical protein WCJ09_01115 [Planctomycetota bacterium]